MKIEHEHGRILSIKGDPDDPHSGGHICPKGVAIQDIHTDKDRLKYPVKRFGKEWRRISWEDAFDEVATRLVDVQSRHGRDAVATYWGNPAAHNHGTVLMIGPFRRCLKTRNNFSATSVDQLPHQFAYYHMYGNNSLFTIPDIDRTDYMLILGANPVVSNGSLWSCGSVRKRMKAVRDRGGKITLIDPRRTETAGAVDAHHFLKPGTDALLLLAVLRVIFEKQLAAPGRLKEIISGWDCIEQLAMRFTVAEVAAATGMRPEVIKSIATEFASADAAVCYGRFGASTQEFGALTQWLIQVLNIVTGNFDRPGGMMFGSPAIDLLKGRSPGSHGRFKSRVRGLAEFSGELPSSALAEEMLSEGPGQIKALVTNAGNPVLSTPNGKQLERALAGLEFMVSVDFYINETTAHADIILPPAGPLEHAHYDLVFNLFAVRDVAKFSPRLFRPEKDTLTDWDIYRELVRKIKAKKGQKPKLTEVAWRWLGKLVPFLGSPEFILDLGLRLGAYGSGFNPFSRGLNLRRLKRHVHGLDLGALKPRAPERLFTRDRKIHLSPSVLVDDVERLKSKLSPQADGRPADHDLLLIGRREIRTNNTWMHNSLRLVKGKNRCTLLIHPNDAVNRNIGEGQSVQVASRTGTLNATAEISDEVMKGVVCLPFGWGHHRPDVSMEVAQAHAGVSINDITDELFIDALSGNAAVNGVPVKVMP